MELYKNKATVSTLVYPTATTGISGSAGVDMSKYREAFIRATCHKLPDQKGEGVVTLTAYENTVSAWGGASAITAGVATASLTSVSDINLDIDLRTAQMSTNNSMDYINAYLKTPTASYSSMQITRVQGRYNPQDS